MTSKDERDRKQAGNSKPTIVEQLRAAFVAHLAAGHSLRSVERESGVDFRQLVRFRDGEAIGIVVADRLAGYLGLKLRSDRKPRRKAKPQ